MQCLCSKCILISLPTSCRTLQRCWDNCEGLQQCGMLLWSAASRREVPVATYLGVGGMRDTASPWREGVNLTSLVEASHCSVWQKSTWRAHGWEKPISSINWNCYTVFACIMNPFCSRKVDINLGGGFITRGKNSCNKFFAWIEISYCTSTPPARTFVYHQQKCAVSCTLVAGV